MRLALNESWAHSAKAVNCYLKNTAISTFIPLVCLLTRTGCHMFIFCCVNPGVLDSIGIFFPNNYVADRCIFKLVFFWFHLIPVFFPTFQLSLSVISIEFAWLKILFTAICPSIVFLLPCLYLPTVFHCIVIVMKYYEISLKYVNNIILLINYLTHFQWTCNITYLPST